MNTTTSNAQRLLRLFEQMRGGKSNTTFNRVQDLGLAFSHLRAMHVLAPDRTLPMKDLADELELTPPSITALTRRLVQSGLVQRSAHENDSRVALLSLTGEGQHLLHELYQHQMGRMEQLLAGLSSEEQTLFLDLMERAVMALRETDTALPTPESGNTLKPSE